MQDNCEEAVTCAFLQCFDRRDNPLVNGYKRAYCNGTQYSRCARRRMIENGGTPPENLTPTGTLLTGQFWSDLSRSLY